MHEYDLIADWYASDRGQAKRPVCVPEVTDLASSLPRGSRVLDIGCGTGISTCVLRGRMPWHGKTTLFIGLAGSVLRRHSESNDDTRRCAQR
jgi:hypothetical protein